MIRNGSRKPKCRPPAGEGAGMLVAYREQDTRRKGDGCSIQTTFPICARRRLTEDRAKWGQGTRPYDQSVAAGLRH